MPPAWRNHREATGIDTPTTSAASAVEIPVAMRRQKSRCTVRDGCGLPGENIAGRKALSARH
ncbi:hypothetical protein [Luteococcus japonicus]|uniref:hypothetical protein n=1 Tax=Luteococcus japonicus TaxID=33984 RepID=UPI002117F074|nr:hypothetical protein [Luteococcus japonicus]